MSSPYRGIDYGMGLSNVDRATGIRYGVISQNSINLDCFEPEYDYGKPHCPSCGNEVIASDDETLDLGAAYSVDALPDWFDGKDFVCVDCQQCYWSDSVYGDEAIGWAIDDGEYKLTDCLDNDIFVLESPYYTYAQYCSPCVPGACSLDSPLDISVPKGPYYQKRLARLTDTMSRCYCLGPEWFDEYNPMPYRCFRIADGKEVKA